MYLNDSIGNSIKTLTKIAEGKHPFCKALVKSKKPSLIVGTGVKKRLDSSAINRLVDQISSNTNIVTDN